MILPWLLSSPVFSCIFPSFSPVFGLMARVPFLHVVYLDDLIIGWMMINCCCLQLPASECIKDFVLRMCGCVASVYSCEILANFRRKISEYATKRWTEVGVAIFKGELIPSLNTFFEFWYSWNIKGFTQYTILLCSSLKYWPSILCDPRNLLCKLGRESAPDPLVIPDGVSSLYLVN